jgi:PP-loop superfamily ATP-utilizing enzyme
VDAAEEYLLGHGFTLVRVRDLGDEASIELSPGEFPKWADEGLCGRVVTYFRELGFRSVSLDPEGYRTGKLSELAGKGQERGT